jgi:hypothetical protein
LIERERKNEWSAPKLPLTISATYLTFCFVVVGVVELAAIVVELEAEITVVVEEGVIHRRGSLFLAPSEEKSVVVLVPPFGTKSTPTVTSSSCGSPETRRATAVPSHRTL